MKKVIVPIQRWSSGENLPLPQYMTPASAGMDLLAAVQETVTILPGQFVKIPTGIAIALPDGYEAQIRPRSGLAARYGVTLVNSPGTIDADYRGEIAVIMINFGQEPFIIQRGDRIAQMVVAPVVQVDWELHDALEVTERGEGGFGHTGVR
jgi:dUTP pyrophosphatase